MIYLIYSVSHNVQTRNFTCLYVVPVVQSLKKRKFGIFLKVGVGVSTVPNFLLDFLGFLLNKGVSNAMEMVWFIQKCKEKNKYCLGAVKKFQIWELQKLKQNKPCSSKHEYVLEFIFQHFTVTFSSRYLVLQNQSLCLYEF